MKIITVLAFILLSLTGLMGISTHNASLDPGLVEKNGIFNLNRYLYENYFTAYVIYGSDDFQESGARLHMRYKPEELRGFYFNADLYMSNISVRTLGGDADQWWGGNMPFFGETYFGFDSEFFDFSLGFKNIKSSDSIYNSIMIDDYSGSFFVYESNLKITRFFDFQVFYTFLRFHQGPWFNGDGEYGYYDMQKQWELHRNNSDGLNIGFTAPIYGKSLYFHKVNIRPAPWIRFGLMENVYFLGENFNPYFANPFFIYFAAAMIDKVYAKKYGSKQGTNASSIKIGLDFNIGFDGWRVFGEMMIDDANGEYVKFLQPDHPDRVGFMIGGELRGLLFDKYLQLPRVASFFIKNLYLNLEFAAVSRYTFSRDHLFNYEYVRAEFPYRYFPSHFKDITDEAGNPVYPDYVDYTAQKSARVNRVGNFIGYMYGNNSDSFDISIGWRNDLANVDGFTAGYISDKRAAEKREKQFYDRLFKIQFHYRRYRLGTGRDVVVPYYENQHFYYDLDPYDDKPAGTDLRTGFVDTVIERGDIFDINIYTDLFRLNRLVVGLEGRTEFKWTTLYPGTKNESTKLDMKFDLGLILGF